MPVMQVGVVRVSVAQQYVAVPMRMRLTDRPVVPMPVMLIVPMAVLVFECFVLMLVVMTFSEVHP
jgi:hypothetical protein